MDLGFSTFSSILSILGLNNLIPTPASETDYWKTILQLLILFAVTAWIYYRILGTYASQLVKGLVVVIALYVITRLLGLGLLSSLLGVILQISVLGFIIIFQPELRRLLEYLGQRDKLLRRLLAASSTSKNKAIVDALAVAGKSLSESHTGALIVLETENEIEKSLLKTGTRVYADISPELILTIFFPKTALHDGAVIIDPEGRITAAGVVLPLSDSKLGWEYGTRHRAALGIGKHSGNPCMIVSEETGKISIVRDGKIEYMETISVLRQNLESIYNIGTQEEIRNAKKKLIQLLSSDVTTIFRGGSFTKKQS